MTPDVEIFREYAPLGGGKFLKKPHSVTVLSMGMYNKVENLPGSPLDAPPDGI